MRLVGVMLLKERTERTSITKSLDTKLNKWIFEIFILALNSMKIYYSENDQQVRFFLKETTVLKYCLKL